MRSLRFFCFLIFSGFFGIFSAAQAQWEETSEIYSLPVTAESLKEWQNPAPEKVEVTFEAAKTTENGQTLPDALVFRVREPFSGRLEFQGPEISVPAVSEAAKKRSLPLLLKGRTPEMFEGQLAFTLRRPDGRKLAGVAGNRDFETAVVVSGSHAREGISASEHSGCRLGGTTDVRLRLVLDLAVPDGRGEFRLEGLTLSQKTVVEHQITSSAQGNVFFEEQGACCVSWALPEQMTRAEVTVFDEEGRQVLTLPVSAGTKETQLPLERRGFYAISASASYADGRSLTTTSTAAVLGPAISDAQRQHSRFGLMLCHMSNDFAKKLGSRWASGWFNFNAVTQLPNGTLRGPQPEELIEIRKPAAPREILYVAAGSGPLPSWLRKPDTPVNGLYPPTDWEKLGECAAVWAKTCSQIPDVIGPYHEVNAAWKGNFEDLIRYHNVVSHAFKKARPDVPVAGPVFCNIDLPFFARCVRAGILNENDGVNIHPYVNGTAPEEDFLTQILGMKSILAENGLGELPIYFTEFGWTCHDGDWQAPVSSLTRARYCARSLILCTALNIRAAIYFAGRFEEPNDVEHYWLVRSNYTPYPALAAYAQTVKELVEVPDGGHFVRLTPDLFAAFFQRQGKGLVVLWTRDGTTARCQMPEMPSQIRSMMGVPMERIQNVTVTPSPIYVELPSCDFSRWSQSAEKQMLLPGSPLPTNDEPLFTSVPTAASIFPQNAKLGPYGVLTRRDGAFTLQEVELVTPLKAAFRELEWDGISPEATLHFEVASRMESDVSGALSVESFRKSVSVPFSVSGKPADVTVRIPVRNGERLTGTATFLIEKPIRRELALSLDLTPLVVPYETPPEVDWAQIPAIRLKDWLRDELHPSRVSPARAELKMAASEKAFRMLLVVHDPEHYQKRASWSFMAQGDSIRVGFDFDAGKPWEFNNIQFGLNGHRVVEYGLSLDEAGKHQWWTNRCWLEGMKSGPAFNLIPGTKITRDETAKTTTYDLTFLWKDLGSEVPPKPGDLLGFSLLLMDQNQAPAPLKFLPFGKGLQKFEPLDWLAIRLGTAKP